MRIVDLTLSIPRRQKEQRPLGAPPKEQITAREEYLKLDHCTAVIYYLDCWGMSGTYIDFPGHIRETDDGMDALKCPAEKLYRVPASVIHLDRKDGSGKIVAEELAGACPRRPSGGALILNALGRKRFDEIANRSVYLGRDAIQWIIQTGIHLFVSDVYESDADPQDVFPTLFKAHIATVCLPVNLHELTAPVVRLTALPVRFERVTQLPCRLIAELE